MSFCLFEKLYSQDNKNKSMPLIIHRVNREFRIRKKVVTRDEGTIKSAVYGK